ncbi:MAG TPA: hypothetical protein VF115_07725 [Acidimicrobiia bacterium]
MMKILKDLEFRGAAVGGLVTASFLFVVIIGVGKIHAFEARGLIEAVLPAARFLGSTVVGASVTVLALLLTLIALSMDSGQRFSSRLYDRAIRITRIAVLCIIMGVVVLLAVSVPVVEVPEISQHYAALYYGLSGALAVLGGLVTSMGLMIGTTLRGLIGAAHPEGESDLVEELAGSSSDG